MKLSSGQWREILASHGAEHPDDPVRGPSTVPRPTASPTSPTSRAVHFDLSGGVTPSCELQSVTYVLALEGGPTPDPKWDFWERALDEVVQTMQPAPSITHIELCMAPNARHDDMHFATYLGAKANWGASFGGQRDFYLGHNASNWRAIPIVCRDASARLRVECAKHVGTEYSIAKYICAIPPLRALAGLLSDVPQTPAHCAILTARCLKAALPEVGLSHPSSWFGPSTLFLDLDSDAKRATFHQRLVDADPHVRAIAEDESETRAMHTLLHGSDDEILPMDEEACALAIHRLTVRSLEPGLDDVAKRIVQKQLAMALLRYSVVKNA